MRQHKKLYLVRHGRAQDDGRTLMDFNRPLSQIGVSHTIALAEQLKENQVDPPECVFCSTATRTRQTYEILQNWLGSADVFFRDSLYLAPIFRLQQVLAQTDNIFNQVMVIGHNMGLQNFVNTVAGEKQSPSFEPSCCAVLKVSANTPWQEITPQKTCLDLFLNPQKNSL